GACVAGACVPCEPGTTGACQGNGLETCNEEGEWEVVSCDAAAPHCTAGACGQPPSCRDLEVTCGAGEDESCCTSIVVTGGTFDRINDGDFPATVSTFRLDKYEVTVGRFRKFAAAWDGGWRP